MFAAFNAATLALMSSAALIGLAADGGGSRVAVRLAATVVDALVLQDDQSKRMTAAPTATQIQVRRFMAWLASCLDPRTVRLHAATGERHQLGERGTVQRA